MDREELKAEILAEVAIKLGEQIKPLIEALKNYIPNTFQEPENLFPRDGFGFRVYRKERLERDNFGVCKAKRKEIQRDGFGQVKRVAIFRS